MDTNHTSSTRNLITAQKEVVNKIKYIKRRGIKFFFLPDIKALCNLPSICFIGVSTPSKTPIFLSLHIVQKDEQEGQAKCSHLLLLDFFLQKTPLKPSNHI